MTNEKNFYDILSSKFNGRETPYDEANWKSMRAMIDASRAAKRRVLWIAASVVGILLCAGGVGLYEWNSGSSKSHTVSPVVINNANNGNASQSVINSSKQVITSNTSVAPVANKTVNANTQSGEMNKEPADNSKQSITNNSPSLTMLNHYINNKAAKTHKHIAKSGSSMIASNDNSSSNNNEEQNNSVAQVANQGNAITNTTNTASVNQGATAQKTVPVVKSAATSKATASVANKTAVHKTDSAIAGDNLPPRFSKEPRIFNGKTNIFSIDAGAEYSGGWQIGSVIQGQGFNPVVGVGYEHYLGSTWFLKAGLQFSTFGHMSPLTYNYQHSVGNVIYDSVITTQRLYFLRMPIQAEYFIGRKKQMILGAGGSVWFLLGNSGFATTDQQIDNNPPVNVVKYPGNAPMSGYSKIDVSAHALFGYALSHKFTIYGILYFELTNMKDNAVFGDNIIQRTRGLQLSASYNLN